ncbi:MULTISPECIES: NAD(P)/FAD-dependent oxidoreductase [unclassified Pseudoclavibacter]|uniref:NAD(P)/FAD-dependent oxidoreductase n=1 Tax=unclassified Pseudoclavibacter TaxID=2615177 RepID=UPI001300F4DA|nr:MULTISPECIES: NAD(P)/FAD-dependent oxidoreductase [unclassified Pseudoclavibacter]KAB1658699.1 NAD(P)/FAD-dependent oxidoreductase [Pseudoclavibacter sp. CFCC 11306]KAB1661240.1 NAD(P)/FAD-dependent oxidoreductase [Pseudoclavibacter sp. CFCC 13796]
MNNYDCIVVGGGPAGLSAALVLARARREVLVVDGNRPRNRATYMSHGFITRDGTPPMALRELGREDLAKYPNVHFQWGEVQHVTGVDGAFTASIKGVRGGPSGEVQARKVLLATGVLEALPQVPDLISYYGSTIFSCVHCDGWERREQSLVVIGENPELVNTAKRASQWADREIVLTNGSGIIEEHQAEVLGRQGIEVDDTPIAALHGDGGRLESVELADGRVLPATGGFVQPEWSLPQVVADLVPTAGDLGGVKTDEYGRSGVDGVYAAGDVRGITPSQLIIAAGEGARAGIGLNNDLIFATFDAPGR